MPRSNAPKEHLDPRTGQPYELLPTGKPHISFSEQGDWTACSWRHKLKHVMKVDMFKPGPLMDFGTAVHAACEDYLKTRTMKPEIACEMITRLWEANKAHPGFEPETIPTFHKEATEILADVPTWLEGSFPGWEFIDAEHELYEPIEGKPHAFKGFIDGVIKCKGPKDKDLIWLLDWKTTGWGWSADKKGDPAVCAQLVLYKSFWSTKTGTDPKAVRCGFVLLKRSAKPGKHCELVTTSVGEVTTGRALTVINNMLSSVKKGIALKNRNSCTFCDYRGTPHCT
jgi:PD-(D/E)XK nuclease superfamily protein